MEFLRGKHSVKQIYERRFTLEVRNDVMSTIGSRGLHQILSDIEGTENGYYSKPHEDS